MPAFYDDPDAALAEVLAGSGLPDGLETAPPTPAHSEAGRDTFAVAAVRVTGLDWLYLAARGHRRAGFLRGPDDAGAAVWSGRWLVP